MKSLFFTLFAACALLPATLLASEQYDCRRIADDKQNGYRQVADEYVELSVDQEIVKSRIHIGAATKDLTFSTCRALPADGSNFSQWFATECRGLQSADSSPYTIEPFLIGAYAGISPVIAPSYILREKLASVSEKLGIATPVRTFVIYANKKPLYEFFCRPR